MGKFLLLAAFAALSPSRAAAASAPAPLPQQVIHTAYTEGDFEKVLKAIEAFNAANKSYSKADSLFIAKHLAVVYSANPGTREKGKHYMYRLLEMMPTAELLDMFVSDEIDRIFDKVRKEFLARQASFGVDTSRISLPAKGTSPAAKPADAQGPSGEYLAARGTEPAWKQKKLWIAGGAGLALAAGAVFTYFHLQGEADDGKKYVIGDGEE